MKFSISCFLVALTTPIAGLKLQKEEYSAEEREALLALYEDKVYETGDGRDLIFDDLCGSLLGGLVGAPLALLGANVTCDCDLELLPPGIDVSCESEEPVCFVPDLVCGNPSLGFGLGILSIFSGGFPFNAKICYDNLVIGGVLDLSFVPFCLSTSLIPGLVAADEVGGGICEATIGDDACSSCEHCGGSKISFNCTNILANLTGTCVDIGIIPSSFSDIVKVDQVEFGVDGFGR